MANFHQSHKPFSRKWPYKESVPYYSIPVVFPGLQYPPQKRKFRNLRKSAELLPFNEGNMFTAFQITSSRGSLTKKFLTFNLHTSNIPTDGKEEQAKYNWPSEPTLISTFSHQKHKKTQVNEEEWSGVQIYNLIAPNPNLLDYLNLDYNIFGLLYNIPASCFLCFLISFISSDTWLVDTIR